MNLAVFLPNWIGDAVMATPALRALRNHFRSAHIVGVARPYVVGLLEGGDWFDELLPAEPNLRDTFAVARRLRERKTILAILFPNSVRSALTAWLGACRQRIGMARDPLRGWLLTQFIEQSYDAVGRRIPRPIIDDYGRIAMTAGCLWPGHRMELFTTASDDASADLVWETAKWSDKQETICLNPGAAFGSAKHWPANYFAELARDLAERRGAKILVLCGPTELGLAREIATLASHPSVVALSSPGMPPPSLGLTKACIRRCNLLVTTDSGPRHFAAAFDRPVVTLFGPTHIDWTETYYSQAIHLQKKVDCGPCQRRVCPLDHRCMTRLLPQEVATAADQLLARAHAPRASA